MATNDRLRSLVISRFTSLGPEGIATRTIRLWESMASEVVPLIGEDGFTCLYARSVYLTQATFPWLAADRQTLKADSRFLSLKTSLEGHVGTEAEEGSAALFETFGNTLIVLIGEPLTTGIFRTACRDGASNITGKENQT